MGFQWLVTIRRVICDDQHGLLQPDMAAILFEDAKYERRTIYR
jgi:hypothetical protein